MSRRWRNVQRILLFVVVSRAANMPPLLIPLPKKKEKAREKRRKQHVKRILQSITGAHNTSKYFLLIKPEYWVSCPEGLITFRLFRLLDKKMKSRYAWFDFSSSISCYSDLHVAMNIHYFCTNARHLSRDDDYGALFPSGWIISARPGNVKWRKACRDTILLFLPPYPRLL